MRLLVAVDVLDGNAVRLRQGDYGRVKRYGGVADVVESWLDQGVGALHFVDLNGAIDPGNHSNREVILSLAERARSCGVFVEVGGGFRSHSDVISAIERGIDRVVVGTSAIQDSNWLASLDLEYRRRVCISLDYRYQAGRAMVATEAWTGQSDLELREAVARFLEQGVEAYLVTSIARDGMGVGPDIELYQSLMDHFPIELIASGGIGGARDLERLVSMSGMSGSIESVVVGTALYERTLDISEATRICAV